VFSLGQQVGYFIYYFQMFFVALGNGNTEIKFTIQLQCAIK